MDGKFNPSNYLTSSDTHKHPQTGTQGKTVHVVAKEFPFIPRFANLNLSKTFQSNNFWCLLFNGFMVFFGLGLSILEKSEKKYTVALK